ncbi:MAG: prepilin-type N-terminal cleavage/methylation domain-containing protein [Thiohalomonadaceae bacterium]
MIWYPSSRPMTQRGFSLLEMLVAFTIMVISLAALYSIMGGSLRGTLESMRYSYAVMTAESLMSLQLSVPAEGINKNGETGDGYRWQITSFPFATEPESNITQLHLIRVQVSWGIAPGDRHVILTSLLPEISQ